MGNGLDTKQEIKDFIFEENYYSAQEKAKRENQQ